MPGAVRRLTEDSRRNFRDPPDEEQRVFRFVRPRQINVAWASIADGDLLPGELVANRADNSLVWRKDDTNIYRFDNDATRTI